MHGCASHRLKLGREGCGDLRESDGTVMALTGLGDWYSRTCL